MRTLDVTEAIIAGDANASSPWWGCRLQNERGTELVESFASMDLQILNEGTTPTFHVYRGGRLYTSIPDVTACTSGLIGKIHSWRVDSELIALSDHRAICFSLSARRDEPLTDYRQTTRKFNTRKANWEKFDEQIRINLAEHRLNSSKIDAARTIEDVDTIASGLVAATLGACHATIPLLKRTGKSRNPWWTPQLSQLKADVIRTRRKIRKAAVDRKPWVIKEYTEKRARYKESIQTAITGSWKRFCESVEGDDVWSKANKILKSGRKIQADTYLRGDTGAILSAEDSAELLMHSFFPEDDPRQDDEGHQAMRTLAEAIGESTGGEASHRPFIREEIAAVLRGMHPKSLQGRTPSPQIYVRGFMK